MRNQYGKKFAKARRDWEQHRSKKLRVERELCGEKNRNNENFTKVLLITLRKYTTFLTHYRGLQSSRSAGDEREEEVDERDIAFSCRRSLLEELFCDDSVALVDVIGDSLTL